MKKQPCVYLHFNNKTNELFYIGKSKENKSRPYNMRKESRNSHWFDYFTNQCGGLKENVKVEVINCATEGDALKLEWDLIQKRKPITNKGYVEPELLISFDQIRTIDEQDGIFFCANDLLVMGNKVRENDNLPIKQLASYFDTDETKEFINQIKWEFGLEEHQIKKVTKGRSGGTWVHPLIFVDLATWISPEFKVKIYKWVLDGLLEHRDNSGDSYKAMNKALTENYNIQDPTFYIRLANFIAKACGVLHKGKDKWQLATEDQLKLRDNIHKRITIYSEVVDNKVDCINKAVNKELELLEKI